MTPPSRSSTSSNPPTTVFRQYQTSPTRTRTVLKYDCISLQTAPCSPLALFITNPYSPYLPQGILYNRGLSCTLKTVESLAAPTLPPNFKRIALIMQGNCTLEQKLLNAQLDLADGAIVYNNMPSGDSDLGLSIMVSSSAF
ncbi:hypothetical protein BC936DRAFT_143911 [Jimgerdemannia flammicorona]|uniref:PA domain-containing protein n=1 Tax=Jimgerdemannia flammicorona TaxID=994334 RepID=A0A432ZYV4_9FUNG|nr:hypothetical protein BC936DRAFT_143911 [Jimgerdemannia flammicorona]